MNNIGQKCNDVVPALDFVKGELQKEFQGEEYGTWFENLVLVKQEDNHLVLGVPNEFAAIWVEENYRDIIEYKLQMAMGISVSVEICAVEENSDSLTTSIHEEKDCLKSASSSSKPTKSKIEVTETSGVEVMDGYILNPKNTFENFVVGPGNQMAHAASIAIANAPGKAYNPLFLYGYTGLGKTHLMHAVAHQVLRQNKKARVAYTSTEKFTNEFIQAVQFNEMTKFRKKYRKIDVLLLDDVHFLSGKERIQEEFFHTFNELFESQKQIFLSSDRPASEISKLESRLVSRFQWGLVTDIQPPDLETRIAILSRKAKDLNVEIGYDVLCYLAEHVSTNIRRLEGALIKVAGYMKLYQTGIDINLVKMIMKDVFKEDVNEFGTSIDMIQSKVAEFYQLKLTDLLGKRRPAHIAMPRQIAMYLCRCLTKQSLVEIGLAFGGRDHGTVIHACKSVENMLAQDDVIRSNVQYLRKVLKK